MFRVVYQAVFGCLFIFSAFLIPIIKGFSRRIRDGLKNYLGFLPVLFSGNTVWFHSVSLGESLVSFSVAETLKERFPELILTFTSTHPDCLKLAKKKNFFSASAYLPLDFFPFLTKALNNWKPRLVLISETDFWPEFIWQCKHRGIPVFLINGRISTKHEKAFSSFRSLGENVFDSFQLLMVQRDEDRKRLINMGASPSKIVISGNIKADIKIKIDNTVLDEMKRWVGNSKIMVIGSLHPMELEILFQSLIRLIQNYGLKIIIAPREIKNAEIWYRKFSENGIMCVLRTSLSDDRAGQVMILNTVGELASIYSLADFAFIGGTLSREVGGHNPFEILYFGKPLMMGPFSRNFNDLAVSLQDLGACLTVSNSEEFEKNVCRLISDDSFAQKIGLAGKSVFSANRGAMQKTLEEISKII
ncbi:MAG: hypothetical protein HQM10_07395 [Candidatus Riflebacteria bacterium]|nr:hypothetical protein [Candidatus Riflebacteria bacterium]